MDNEEYPDQMYDHLHNEVEGAFMDVEADFPDAECGWEVDIARTICEQQIQEGHITRHVAREYMRRSFGARL